jgi:hypothetical protein
LKKRKNADILEELIDKDPRVKRIARMVDIETEIRDSEALKLFCAFAEDEAKAARIALETVDPSNMARIIELQFRTRLPDFIKDVISGALLSGKAAEREMNEERLDESGIPDPEAFIDS